ncbi:BlaI/MecI/CopY family transcriptional regulator [Chitinimonas sp. JJ19]|uniref:BlaI/MecI/CopY family transcriptional regulator n=1 Tax=Chitinimonas sp. JJ19 TaxID=3109352 RepID=UPI003002C6E2
MTRPTAAALTDAERELLEVLWRKKQASVREVTDEIAKKKSVAYTTVLTMFKVLEKKGLVTYHQEGRAFIYTPTISRGEARKSALERLLKQFFNGSPQVLAQHLIEQHEMSPDELDALKRLVAEAPDAEEDGTQ